MLRGMITHPLHLLLRGTLTHPLHDIDADHDNLSNMLRAHVNDQGCSIINEVMRYKTLHSLQNTDIEANN
eukprot:1019158-Ditylum_brightwellii.AAC.1